MEFQRATAIRSQWLAAGERDLHPSWVRPRPTSTVAYLAEEVAEDLLETKAFST
jgi:hypothetical protein